MTALYERDPHEWSLQQASFLKSKHFENLDVENLVEEIESLGANYLEKLESHLENILVHKLKVKYQSEKHTKSWDDSIAESSERAKTVLKKSPSLKPKLKEILKEAYKFSRFRAARETGKDIKNFPEKCPWDLSEFFPDLKEKYTGEK